ncbi:MAG: RHS repeat protein, partial [Ruminococcus sp.]|nr:RHS repeat protein [Ruminococcus sp.]
ISGKVSIVGSAYDETGLRSFKLEYKRADESAYKLITSSLSDRHDAELGVLDTYPLDNAVYEIRLTVIDNGGNSKTCSVQYQVKNGAEAAAEKVSEEMLVFTKPEPSVTADSVIKVEAKADPTLADKEYEVTLRRADGTGTQQTIKNGKLDGNGNISASADSSMLNDGDYIVTIAVKVPDGDSVKKDITVKVKHDYVKAAEDVKCTIVSPDYNAEITAPSEIKAEVTENKFSRYKFEYSPAGKNDYTVFAKGAVAGKEITGKLDPTLMENGFYDIRVTAYGDKITAEDTTTVELTGNMKIGNFTLSFADLEFEAYGIPVTMIRTYDSRNKDKNGEFGYGWDLSYNTVKLDINSDQSENWTEKTSSSFFVTQFEIMETKQHKIKIDLSNGVTDEFTMALSPARQVLIPQHYDLSVSYVSTTNSGATLVPCDMNANGLFYDSGVLLNSEFNYYNPQRFIYTRPDGTEYMIDSKLGLMRIKSSDGSVINFNKNGVSSTDGKNIKFVYDKEGRIVEASDSTGKKLTYEYDVFGDLVSVKDQAEKTTSFVYKKHYITEIYDSRGVMLSKNEYDDDGRLVKTTDPDGNEIVYDHDIDGREEAITDRNGGVTRYIYDDNGNILSQTDANGNTVKNTYDSNGNLLTKTDALGN